MYSDVIYGSTGHFDLVKGLFTVTKAVMVIQIDDNYDVHFRSVHKFPGMVALGAITVRSRIVSGHFKGVRQGHLFRSRHFNVKAEDKCNLMSAVLTPTLLIWLAASCSYVVRWAGAHT